jgi:large repetitive protein
VVLRATKAALTLTLAVGVTIVAVLAAGPASANYPPPTLRLLCSAAANNGTLEPSPLPQVCVLPSGQTTAPNNYSATVAVRKTGVAATITFTVTAGRLPAGLSLPASSPSATSPVITGNPTLAGTFNFTIKATGGGLTATLAYQITITVQGPPDQLVCNPAINGGFLENGVCVLPDAILGQPYTGHLPTSHQAGGTLSVVSGNLEPGLSLPASFTGSGDVVSGTPTAAGVAVGNGFTVRGTGDQGQPLYQAYFIQVQPENQPLTVNNDGPNLSPGFAGQAYTAHFFVAGGAAPYTWSLVSGKFPPGLALTTFSDPRDANDELVGTPTTLGTYTFTMRVTDYTGQQASQQFTVTDHPPLQVPITTLPSATVGVPYSHDLDNSAQGGLPPYSWYVVNNINELPPGLTLDTTPPDFNNLMDGTPTQAGTFSFPMQVQDSFDNTVNATLTIIINR